MKIKVCCHSEYIARLVLEKMKREGGRWLLENPKTKEDIIPKSLRWLYTDGVKITWYTEYADTYNDDYISIPAEQYLDDFRKPIVIYRSGDRVIAFDQQTEDKAVAKCHKDDDFDFYFGAKLAFGRLPGFPKKPNTKKETFLDADICVTEIVAKLKGMDTASFPMTVGRIYRVKDGHFVDDDGLPHPTYREGVHDLEDLEDYLSGESRGKTNWTSLFEVKFVQIVE